MARFTNLPILLLFFLLPLLISISTSTDSPSPAPTPSSGADSTPPPSPSPENYPPTPSPESSPPTPSPESSPPSPSPDSSPESSPADSDAPAPVPEKAADEVRMKNVKGEGEERESGGGMSGGKKAGIAFGVIGAVCVVGVAGFVYKKRKENIRRSEYGYAARTDIL